MQGIFSNTTFLQFWAFLLVYITILEEITWKFVFISSIHTWKNIILYSKKNGDLGTMPYYLSKIASVEKIWTLFNCISWCLTDHMTIWTKFVNDNGGLLEYLLSGMWSFGDLCIFGCKNIRRLLFLWFWGLAFCGAIKITGSFPIFHYTSAPKTKTQKPRQTLVICWTP